MKLTFVIILIFTSSVLLSQPNCELEIYHKEVYKSYWIKEGQKVKIRVFNKNNKLRIKTCRLVKITKDTLIFNPVSKKLDGVIMSPRDLSFIGITTFWSFIRGSNGISWRIVDEAVLFRPFQVSYFFNIDCEKWCIQVRQF